MNEVCGFAVSIEPVLYAGFIYNAQYAADSIAAEPRPASLYCICALHN